MVNLYNLSCGFVNNSSCLTGYNRICTLPPMAESKELETIGSRLKRARLEAGLSQKQLADLSGISQQMISKLESGKAAETAQPHKLAAALGVRTDWLLTGQGPMRAGRGDLVLRRERSVEPIEPGNEFVPIRKVKIKPNAGITGYAIEVPEEDGRPVFYRADWIREKRYNPEKLVAMVVSGRSMEPSLYDGDLIVINLDDTEPREGEVYVLNLEGEIVVKRLRRERGQWIATSDNQDKRRYPDKPIDSEHAKIIGRVVYKQSEVI